jgi:hypothetical protein
LSAAAPHADERRVPPVTEIGAASMVFVAAGVVYLAAYLPKRAPLGIALACLGVAAALLATNAILLARTRDYAWWRFFQVGRWALLGYFVIAGMLEYTFVYDHTRGALLAVMTAFLAIFTVNVPLLMAFTVARYERGSRR